MQHPRRLCLARHRWVIACVDVGGAEDSGERRGAAGTPGPLPRRAESQKRHCGGTAHCPERPSLSDVGEGVNVPTEERLPHQGDLYVASKYVTSRKATLVID